jgi:hypothetical protein
MAIPPPCLQLMALLLLTADGHTSTMLTSDGYPSNSLQLMALLLPC